MFRLPQRKLEHMQLSQISNYDFLSNLSETKKIPARSRDRLARNCFSPFPESACFVVAEILSSSQ